MAAAADTAGAVGAIREGCLDDDDPPFPLLELTTWGVDNDGVVANAPVVTASLPPPGRVLGNDDVVIVCTFKRSIIAGSKFDMLFLLANLFGNR